MALPKIDVPVYEMELLSNGEKIEFRPYLVKEEKILLQALQNADASPGDILRAVKQVINNCVVTDGFDVDKLTSFDVEHIFLQLRAKSVGEVITLQFRHRGGKNRSGVECKKVNAVHINIDDIKIVWHDKVDSKIQLTDNIGVKLRYPSMKILSEVTESHKDWGDRVMALLHKCTEYVWDENEMYKLDDVSEEEVASFYETLTGDQFKKLEKFFKSIPTMEYDVEYECAGCGEKTVHKLSGLQDFFV